MEDLSVVFDRISPDGGSVLTSEKIDGNTDIFISSSDASNRQRLTYDLAFDSDMEFSPDGQRIVYESFVGDLSTAEVIVMNRDGSGKTTIAHGTDPGWSPDGKQIIFKARDQAGKCCEVYIINRDGSEQMMLAENGYFQQFVPNGRRIIYFAIAGGAHQIFSIKPDGSDRRQLTQP
jgi:TolB protein